jgi:hypothetical protein
MQAMHIIFLIVTQDWIAGTRWRPLSRSCSMQELLGLLGTSISFSFFFGTILRDNDTSMRIQHGRKEDRPSYHDTPTTTATEDLFYLENGCTADPRRTTIWTVLLSDANTVCTRGGSTSKPWRSSVTSIVLPSEYGIHRIASQSWKSINFESKQVSSTVRYAACRVAQEPWPRPMLNKHRATSTACPTLFW